MTRPARSRLFACFSVRRNAVFCLCAGLLFFQTAMALPAVLPTAAAERAVPVILYRGLLENPSEADGDIVTIQTVESDLRYLRERGYTAIFARELADAVHTGEPLPGRPILLVFDGGRLDGLTRVLPLLEQYDMKAVVPIVGSHSQRASERREPDSVCNPPTWEDITALVDSGRFEIANQTYHMHRQFPRRGIGRIPGESDADHYRAVTDDIGTAQSLLEEHCGLWPTTFVFPYECDDGDAAPMLQEMGFTALLCRREKVNYIAADPSILLSLGYFRRPNDLPTEKYMKRLGIG